MSPARGLRALGPLLLGLGFGVASGSAFRVWGGGGPLLRGRRVASAMEPKGPTGRCCPELSMAVKGEERTDDNSGGGGRGDDDRGDDDGGRLWWRPSGSDNSSKYTFNGTHYPCKDGEDELPKPYTK